MNGWIALQAGVEAELLGGLELGRGGAALLAQLDERGRAAGSLAAAACAIG